ncbi:TPA: hypothetical protein DDZ86_04705 [Candidatus Dependentiae bacterium]|nr:hypothetical protein [Candidatus Dependentiae bacterium]
MRQVFKGSSGGVHRIIGRFKAFAVYGSIIDLAIYTLFMDIVYSLVANILTPLVGLIFFGIDLSRLTITLKNAVVAQGSDQVIQEAITLNIGVFVKTVITFGLIAIPFFIAAQLFLNPRRDYKDQFSKESEDSLNSSSSSHPKNPSSTNLTLGSKQHKATRLSDKKSQEELLLEIHDLLKQLTAK